MKAIELIVPEIKNNYQYIKDLNNMLRIDKYILIQENIQEC